MNLLELLKFVPLILGAYLAFHLIFSQKLPTKKLSEVVTYFIGIIIIFFLVGWLVTSFLAGWATDMLEVGTTDEWENFINQSEDLVNDALTDGTTISPTSTPTTVQTNDNQGINNGGSQAPPIDSGQEILRQDGATTYTIVAGDTLYSISRKFGVTVDEIRRANPQIPSGSGTIIAGEPLNIPAPKK